MSNFEIYKTIHILYDMIKKRANKDQHQINGDGPTQSRHICFLELPQTD